MPVRKKNKHEIYNQTHSTRREKINIRKKRINTHHIELVDYVEVDMRFRLEKHAPSNNCRYLFIL